MGHQRKYAANCSLLFKEVDLLERAAAAKAAGLRRGRVLVAVAGPAGAGRRRRRRVRRVGPRRRRPADRPELLRRRPGRPRLRRAVDPGALGEFTDNIDVAVGHRPRARRRRLQRAVRQPGRRASTRPSRTRSARPEPALAAAEAAADDRRHRAGRAGQRTEAVPAAHRRGRRLGPRRRAAPGRHNVGFLADLFHLANNGDDVDAAIDARTPTGSPTYRSPTARPRRAGQRRPRPRRLPRPARGRRATPAGSPSSTTRPRPRPRASPGCPAIARQLS